MTMRLVQFLDVKDARRVGAVSADGRHLEMLDGVSTVLALAEEAIVQGVSLEAAARERIGAGREDYDAVIRERRVLVPVDHPEPACCQVTGTGLTHLGSADARDKMHTAVEEAGLSDSMKMFRWGLEGGRPEAGAVGSQPEWFYKGNGRFVVAPEQALVSPAFAEDGGEEPELAGIYLIAADGTPMRLGFALANEFSDHVMERKNYLFLAHSKLRQSSFGPELRLGLLPADIRGTSRLRRGGEVVWEKPFLTGEENMSHSLANLEHHHFKYPEHRVPGDLHVHFFGTATLSFSDGIRAEAGDVFEIEAEGFGRALRNPLEASAAADGLVAVKGL